MPLLAETVATAIQYSADNMGTAQQRRRQNTKADRYARAPQGGTRVPLPKRNNADEGDKPEHKAGPLGDRLAGSRALLIAGVSSVTSRLGHGALPLQICR